VEVQAKQVCYDSSKRNKTGARSSDLLSWRRGMDLFLCYCFSDEPFVKRVSYHLSKQPGLQPYCYGDERHTASWRQEVGMRLEKAEAFLFFLGCECGDGQVQEALAAMQESAQRRKIGGELRLYLVELPEHQNMPADLKLYNALSVRASSTTEDGAAACSRTLVLSLTGTWIPDDGIPIGYPFDYEKGIIKAYSKGDLPSEMIERGCPKEWPRVERRTGTIENKIDASEIGLYRDWNYDSEPEGPRKEDPQVVVAALTDFHTEGLISHKLSLPEAGPRRYLAYPSQKGGQLKVGIMVSGGIAPGINAVIAGIVERQNLYAERGGYRQQLEVWGYQNGLSSLFRKGDHRKELSLQMTREQANLGGSMLGTSRAHEFMTSDPARMDRALESAVHRLHDDHDTEILYIIGGDGSMRAAHSLWKKAQDMGKGFSVVGIPKTMDNDILWIWQSFGFLSAVEWSKGAIQQLYTEAKSNPRLCVIQLFGSDSGFVVTHAATASGNCDLFLIPEVRFRMKHVIAYVTDRLQRRYKESKGESAYGVVLMAETAIPLDAADYTDDPVVNLTADEKEAIHSFLRNPQRRVFGQTPDELRTGGLKLVSRVLQKQIRLIEGDYWHDFRVFTNEPRHLIRALPPSSADIIFGHRLGSLAVDCAMAGYTDFMISQWLTEYVMVPLRLVNLGRKRIPQDGIFYKSACASTGQPADLDGSTR
jgi:6-phosphofructokinase 1